MRKYISILLGILLLITAYFIASFMIKSNKREKKKAPKIVKTVFIDIVKNTDIPITIKAHGNLVAKNKIEIYSEVQGVLHATRKDFKPGTTYNKGEVILKINNEEHIANLQVQKSKLYNSITSIMPDIRLDFPDEYEKWKTYLNSFNFDEKAANNKLITRSNFTKKTPELPVMNSEKEKFFISGRDIFTSYYNVKNMEVRLSKYTIRAPYNGILTEALVSPGALVRQGQKLGEFIDPSVYEMEIAINANYIDLLQNDNTVTLHNLEQTKTWKGKVTRVNGKIDQTSQTVKAFIQVKGDLLKEGMYLEANLVAKKEPNAYQISRKLLVNNESVYVLNDSVLNLATVKPVYFKDKFVVIKGLENGTKILSRNIPGTYPGMIVKAFNENKQN